MLLYRTHRGPLAAHQGKTVALGAFLWDELLNHEDLRGMLERAVADGKDLGAAALPAAGVLAPIGSQEVWAAGVTYYRSRDARIEESKAAGGGSFYDKVYSAERPELFLKATPHRVVGPGEAVRIRRDSKWDVPEPELTLCANARGRIVGVTIGNDMSSRDIEGQNPLYLAQAKVYRQCCALGPALLVREDPLPPSTRITLEISRGGAAVFAGETRVEMLKRRPDELVGFLFRDNSFPHGAYLLTGTGIVPPNEFSLAPGDRIRMAIEGIGVLENDVVRAS